MTSCREENQRQGAGGGNQRSWTYLHPCFLAQKWQFLNVMVRNTSVARTMKNWSQNACSNTQTLLLINVVQEETLIRFWAAAPMTYSFTHMGNLQNKSGSGGSGIPRTLVIFAEDTYWGQQVPLFMSFFSSSSFWIYYSDWRMTSYSCPLIQRCQLSPHRSTVFKFE